VRLHVQETGDSKTLV